MPRYEGDGWRSRCTDLPADAYSDPPHWTLREDVLWPKCSGAVRLPIPGRQSGVYAAPGEYIRRPLCLETSASFPSMCESSLTNISYISRVGEEGRPGWRGVHEYQHRGCWNRPTIESAMPQSRRVAPGSCAWGALDGYSYLTTRGGVLLWLRRFGAWQIDEQYPELAEQVVQWQAAQRGATSAPPWQPSDFGQQEQAIFDKLPDLREMLDQAKTARVTGQVPVQLVAPMQLPFTSVRDLDHQRQWHHDQTLAKWQPSPLEAEQRKRAKTPPQPDPHDALDGGHAQTTEQKSRDWGHSRVRDKDRQKELDRVRACSKSRKCSKSQKWSKSRRQSKSRKRSKSHGHNEGETCGRHEMKRPRVWPSQRKREGSGQSPSSTTKLSGRSAEQSAPRSELSNFLKLKEEVVKHAQS